MSQLDAEEVISNDEQLDGFMLEKSVMRDYDDEPYGENNLLVRAAKRRTNSLRRN